MYIRSGVWLFACNVSPLFACSLYLEEGVNVNPFVIVAVLVTTEETWKVVVFAEKQYTYRLKYVSSHIEFILTNSG